MDKTPLGLTRLDPAESLSADGYSFQAINPLIIDRLLRVGAYLHRHDAHVRLGDPAVEAEITAEPLGGMIPSDTLIGVCYTVVDEYGGESLPSPIASVSTAPGIAEPFETPVAEIDNTQGNLRNGTYYYVVTLTDDTGGETMPSPPLQVDIQPGNDNNAIILSGLSDIVTGSDGATGWRLYKSTGQSRYHYLADGPAGLDAVTDDGLLCADCLTEPPTTSHTNSTNKVTVIVPSDGVVAGAELVRVYLGLDGDFTSPALAGEYTPVEAADAELEFTALNLDTGTPPDASTTVAGAQKINPDTDILNWPWKAPVATVTDLPDDAEEGDVRFVLDDGTLWLYKGVEWIQYTAPPQFWKSPVSAVGELPSVGNVPGDVRVVMADFSLHVWDVAGGGSWKLLSPRTVPIQDEGVALTERGAMDFVGPGVTVTDDADNNKTIITIAGGGGGGGSAEFLSPDEGPAWHDSLAGPFNVRLRVANDQQILPLRQGVAPDNWLPANAVNLVGDHLELEGRANEDISLGLAGGPLWGNGWGTAVKATWEILSDNWEYIGLKFTRGNGGTALEGRLVRDDAELQVFDAGVQIASLPLVTPVPAIGERWTLTLFLRPESAASGGWAWWFQDDKGSQFGYDGAGEGEIAWPNDKQHYPFITGYWTNVDAFTIEDYAFGGNRIIHDLILQDDVGPGQGGTTGVNRVVLGADGYMDSDGYMGWTGTDDWAYYDYYRTPQAGRHGMFWVLSGKFVKFQGAAPVPDELILTIDFSQGATTMRPNEDFEFPVVTGDIDGRELGMVQVKKNGEVRWLAGRSSNPSVKTPYVRLDGINIPLARTYVFE